MSAPNDPNPGNESTRGEHDPAKQRREFLRKLAALGLAHFGIAYVGSAPHASPRAMLGGSSCGTMDAQGEIVQDAACGLPAAAPERDIDCGLLSEVGNVSTDNSCALIKADGTRFVDRDCGKLDGAAMPSVDNDCGLSTGSSARGTLVDNDCGKLLGASEPPQYALDQDCGQPAAGGNGNLADGDCGKLSSAGAAPNNDADCGSHAPAGGGNLSSDEDCGLAYGSGGAPGAVQSDQDCGLSLDGGPTTEADNDCGQQSQYSGLYHIDNG
ncbi:MAG: hypothetical protein EPO68_14580 [Planctomycetota bacterium]|nr:MAG: hypothetical protein EPO68_14580 [Planctomycetota bacterium]